MDLRAIHDIYLRGAALESPWDGDPSFEGVLRGEEFDYVWRLVELPLEVVGCGVDLSLAPNDGCDEVDENERFEQIRRWADGVGSLRRALLNRPPAVVIDDAQALMVDGRHRLALAARAGMSTVPVAVAMPLGYEPPVDLAFPWNGAHAPHFKTSVPSP